VHHPQRSAITRAVGTESDIEADVVAVPAELGDLYLLCSDGLTDMLGADEIPALESPPRRRYFSPWFTFVCTLLAIGLIVVYAAPWRGSPRRGP